MTMMMRLGIFPLIFLSSCSQLFEVRTINRTAELTKKAGKREGLTQGTVGLAGGGYGGNPHARLKEVNNDVAVGTAPVEAGFLPAVVGDNVIAGGMKLPSDDDIAWLPMDLKKEAALGKAFKKKPKRKSPWYQSYTEARRESMRTGKPLLIWFTRTASPRSPMCARLQRELFSKNDFGDWAKENLVRLKVDASGGDPVRDDQGQLTGDYTKRRKYAEKLKKQFRVLGHPTLVVLQPDGAVYARERGYGRGEDRALWDKLKNAVLTIGHNHSIWERKMAQKGYRRWKGADGGEVFARLRRYHKNNLWLVEPDGNVIKTSQKNLSKEDRAWIIAEKEKRGIE